MVTLHHAVRFYSVLGRCRSSPFRSDAVLLVIIVMRPPPSSTSFRLFHLIALIHSFTTLVVPVSAAVVLPFPDLFSVATDRPISATPSSSSSCGVQTVDGYCTSSPSPVSVADCHLAVCNQACPYRSPTPSHQDLLADYVASTAACVSEDRFNVRPGSGVTTAAHSLLFVAATGQESCYVTPARVPSFGGEGSSGPGSMTMSFWAWLATNSRGYVVIIVGCCCLNRAFKTSV